MNSTIQRIDRLTAPPIVGQFYLVRTVRGHFFAATADWPVIGTQHEDREIGAIPIQHYHLDWRFMPAPCRKNDGIYSYVLHSHNGEGPLPKPIWRRRKCVRPDVPFFVPWTAHPGPVHKVRELYAGQECARDAAGGFICPHRNASLGSVAPCDGVIVCPLHGLRIDAATGVVLPLEVRR